MPSKKSSLIHIFKHLPSKVDFILKSKTLGHGQRYYGTPEGRVYPSITTVLSADKKTITAINNWKKRVGEKTANKIVEKARDRGDNIHKLLELCIKNELPNLNEASNKAKILFKQFTKHLQKINNIHLQETALYSNALKVAGRVDLIAEYDGDVSIIDFKGSNKLKKKEWIENYFLQVTAYAVMYYERTGVMVKKIIVIVGTDNIESQFTGAQIFIENPKNYLEKLKSAIKEYYETHNVPASLNG